MSDFTLPSGRVVQLKPEPTWGDLGEADEAGLTAEKEGRAFGHARATRMMALMTGLSDEEVKRLPESDANALAGTIRRHGKDAPTEQAFRDAVATFFMMGSLADPPRELVEFVIADRFKWSPQEIAALPVSVIERYQQILAAEADFSKLRKPSD